MMVVIVIFIFGMIGIYIMFVLCIYFVMAWDKVFFL